MTKGKFKVIEIIQRGKAEAVMIEFIQNRKGARFDELPSEILDKDGIYIVRFTLVKKKKIPEFNT